METILHNGQKYTVVLHIQDDGDVLAYRELGYDCIEVLEIIFGMPEVIKVPVGFMKFVLEKRDSINAQKIKEAPYGNYAAAI